MVLYLPVKDYLSMPTGKLSQTRFFCDWDITESVRGVVICKHKVLDHLATKVPHILPGRYTGCQFTMLYHNI